MLSRWSMVLGLVVAAGLAAGCGKPSAESSAGAQVTVHKIAADEMGKEFVCPVMGVKTKVTAETPALEYKGKVYYFCCEDCPGKFKADPEKYVNKPAPAGSQTQ